MSAPSTPTTTSSRNPSPAPARRPNRAALRDYYNLKTSNATDVSSNDNESVQHEEVEVKESELDAEGFDAEGYVRGVLAGEGVEGVLRVEGGLIGEIKGLDGERKALVYDNYSKLITATDTIRKMRTNMDPLTPTTSTISPAISHIADVTASLAASLQTRSVENGNGGSQGRYEGMTAKRKQRETVRWVVDAPRRLGRLLDDGKREAAERDWSEIKGLLEKWKGVVGAENIREECERIMEKR